MSKVCVEGVGINNSPTPVYINRVICPFYRKWKNMRYRCYSHKYHNKEPTYKDCTVCEDWLTFSNFKSWMEKQDWEGKDLDKDLLVRGNKIYSPDTCCFLPRHINRFIQDKKASRGEYPLGVYLNKKINKFISQVSDPFTGCLVSLGSYKHVSDAHQAWRCAKNHYAKRLSTEIPESRISKALWERYEEDTWGSV